MCFLWGGCGLSQVVRGAGRGRQRVCGGSQARLRTARRPTTQPLAGNLVQSLPQAVSLNTSDKIPDAIIVSVEIQNLLNHPILIFLPQLVIKR